MKRYIAGAIVALSLTSCAGTVTAPSSIERHKALLVAVASVDGAAKALDAAAKSGVLRGHNAAVAETALRDAQSALDAARTADAVGDAKTEAERIAAVSALVVELMTLAGAH